METDHKMTKMLELARSFKTASKTMLKETMFIIIIKKRKSQEKNRNYKKEAKRNYKTKAIILE